VSEYIYTYIFLFRCKIYHAPKKITNLSQSIDPYDVPKANDLHSASVKRF